MKQLTLILLSALSTFNLFSMNTQSEQPQNVVISIVSVEQSFDCPHIHERPAELLDSQLVDIATNHAPDQVKRIISSLQSPETLKKPIAAILTGAGVGKTTLAQAIAQRARVNCKLLSTACMGTNYLFSEQDHVIQAIAPLIETTDPWVVVLDDIDYLRHYTKVFNLRKAGNYGESGVEYRPNDTVVSYDPIESRDRYCGETAHHVISPARVLCDLLDMFKERKKNNKNGKRRCKTKIKKTIY